MKMKDLFFPLNRGLPILDARKKQGRAPNARNEVSSNIYRYQASFIKRKARRQVFHGNIALLPIQSTFVLSFFHHIMNPVTGSEQPIRLAIA